MTILSSTHLRLKISRNFNIQEVIQQWNAIALATSNASPFLTAAWIESWLSSLPEVPQVALLIEGEKTVGICIIGESVSVNLGVKIRTALINQAGKPDLDQVWIEYNDVVCIDQYKADFYRLLSKELSRQGFDKLSISMAEQNAILPIRKSFKRPIDTVCTKGFIMPLSKNTDVLADLSSNSRSQIKRSNKKLEAQYGPLTILRGNSVRQKEEMLISLSILHRKQWGSTQFGSGFDNPVFSAQLQKLMLDDTNFIDIVSVNAGDTVVGYSLNYLLGDTVYFYCSGINYDIASKHIKPGYSLHLMIMNYYAQNGFAFYDYMGGESQYKKSLSKYSITFQSISVPLRTIKGYILQCLYFVRALRQ